MVGLQSGALKRKPPLLISKPATVIYHIKPTTNILKKKTKLN